jgi:glycosyltransferase involved in cell wall biosynthesis
VLCEVSRDEHDARLRTAALYLICLRETGPSAGHVRLMAAVGAGAPVIASGVPGLREYVEDGRTAVLVEPSDTGALRHAVDDLLADPSRRKQLRQRAFERASRIRAIARAPLSPCSSGSSP